MLTATAKGYSPTVREFHLAGEVVFAGIHLKHAKPLIVRVVTAKGEPLADARLFLQRWHSGYTNGTPLSGPAHGRTRPRGLERGRRSVYLSVSHFGYIQVSAELTADGREQTVTLLPELKVSGSVIDDKSGNPIEQRRRGERLDIGNAAAVLGSRSLPMAHCGQGWPISVHGGS